MALLISSVTAFEGGIYSANGTQNGKLLYSGNIMIEELTSLWQIRWNTTVGSFSGFGFLADSTLFGAWGKSGAYGLVLYENTKEKGIIGRITVSGRDNYVFTGQSEKIVCIKNGSPTDPFIGTFAVTGYDSPADGKSGAIVYAGKLSVEKKGEWLYHLPINFIASLVAVREFIRIKFLRSKSVLDRQ